MIDHTDPWALGAVLLALILGGVLKGATGAGAPVITIPVIAAVFDIRVAVAIMATSNLLTNAWQLWQFRRDSIDKAFIMKFVIAGALGAVLGTIVLALLPIDALQLMTAGIVIAYIALRLLRPSFELQRMTAERLVVPIGFAAGVLQGAAGISAPVSLSFLNAMRLHRPAFIATISAFFVTITAVQIPVLTAYGLLTWQLLGVGLLAFIPLLAGIPLGSAAAARIGPKGFDRIVLIFLALLAVRLVWTAFT